MWHRNLQLSDYLYLQRQRSICPNYSIITFKHLTSITSLSLLGFRLVAVSCWPKTWWNLDYFDTTVYTPGGLKKQNFKDQLLLQISRPAEDACIKCTIISSVCLLMYTQDQIIQPKLVIFCSCYANTQYQPGVLKKCLQEWMTIWSQRHSYTHNVWKHMEEYVCLLNI